jgi:hypothetical protein
MLRNTAAALAFAAAFVAPTAAAWRHPLDAGTLQVSLSRTSANTSGQFWAIGASATGAVLARYDDGVAPALTLALPPGEASFDAMRTTERGDLVAVRLDAAPSTRCTIVKIFSDGRRRWSQPLDDCAGGTVRLWPASGDGEWVTLPRKLVQLAADGREIGRLANASLAGVPAAIDPRNDTLYVTGPNAVVAYDRHGSERWRAPIGAPTQVAVAADGSLRVTGSANARLAVTALGADGTTRWSKAVDDATPGRYAVPLVDADGATLIAGGTDAALKLDANGNVAWRADRATLGLPTVAATLDASLAPNGDLVLAYGDRIGRVDASGRTRFARRIVSDSLLPPLVGIVAIGADGAAVVGLRESQPPRIGLARIDADGSDLAAPLPIATATPIDTPSRALLPDGSIVAWSGGAAAAVLERIDANGRRLWRVDAAPSTGPRAIVADASRVCTLGADVGANAHRLACHRTSDGERLYTRTLRSDVSTPRVARLHLAADGTVSAWYGHGQTVEHARVDRDGNVLTTTARSGAVLVDTTTQNAPFALIVAGMDAFVVGTDGEERVRTSDPVPLVANASFDADGGFVALVADNLMNYSLMRYDAQGRLAWSTAQFAYTQTPTPPVVAGSGVFVAVCCDDASRYRVQRLALATGETVWQRDVALSPDASGHALQLAPSPDGSTVATVSSAGRTLDIDAYDARDGAPRGRQRERCADAACTGDAALVASGGRVHLVETGVSGNAALASFALPGAQAPIRVDQLGLTGAWWSPYADGEGLVIDYLPDSRTLFIPWFTYARGGGNTPAGLRWYAVQGSVAPNATSAELAISEATGGAFDDGPVVAARRVGKATLRFTDCGKGSMTYAFDDGENRGAQGTLTLERLSPATESCLLADGTIRPGAGSRPFANGFDARMSGSWFEPSTSGQGLQFVVQPGAFLFIPWFTYDPAGAADDPTAQRWFTLQGSLERARNGVVEVPIVETIGGAFDRVPTNNANVVGKATLSMLACDRARLDYRFDDSDVAGTMRGRTGSIGLDKIGGCATP